MQHYSHDATVDRVMTERSMFGLNTKSSSKMANAFPLPRILTASDRQSGAPDLLASQQILGRDNFEQLRPPHQRTDEHNTPKSAQQPSLVFVCNNFTFEFLHQFTKNMHTKRSVVISPFSIIQLFVIMYVTSKSRSETDMQNYFSFSGKASTFQSLIELNVALHKTGVFKSTNILCICDAHTVNNKFADLLEHVGSIISFNYKSADATVRIVNNIAAKTTNGMIDNVISANMLQPPTDFALINVIYFYSKWKSPFSPQMTSSNVPFRGKTTKVTMMTQYEGRFNHFVDNDQAILEMDYVDGYFSMGFVLSSGIDRPHLERLVSQLSQKQISVLKIPKFKQEFKYKIDNIFRENGLNSLFQNLDTDLVNTQTAISYIIHGAAIIVDEAGTKAAAHTSMVSENCASVTKEEIKFIADRPFTYYIRYKPQNLIVFIGQFF